MPLPEQIVGKILEPGEKILWTGVPDMKGLLIKRHIFELFFVIFFIAAIIFAYEFYQQYKTEFEESLIVVNDIPFMALQFLLDLDLTPGRYMMIGVAIVLVTVIVFLKFVPLKKYFESQTYAITNRRLLVLDGGEVMRYEGGETAFKPRDLVNVEIIKRRGGFGDVIFARNSGQYLTKVKSKTKDPLYEAKLSTGFKLQKNPAELLKRIQDWQQDASIKMDKKLAGFLQADFNDSSEKVQKIENSRIGLKMVAPVEWTVTVKKGNKSFDRSPQARGGWKPLGQSDDWNIVKIYGTRVYQLEVGLFLTNQQTTYKEQAKGRIIDSNENYEFAGHKGFMFEVKRDINSRFEPAGPILRGKIFSVKTIVLQEPGREIVIVATYADDTPTCKQVIDRMLESIQIDYD